MPLERDAIGRYELLLELARGGMAVLYLARAQGVGGFSRLFAIKQILPHLAADPQFVEMFLNEGRIAARLSHPNLCPVFELGQERGELFLVMEYLDGVPWERAAAAAPRDARGLALTAGVLAQACEGLHYAHTFHDVDGTPMPIVHRDVSPQNVFVSADGVCRVLDFGVSKIATDHRRTRTGLLKGKLPYMAPEQIRGEPADGRTDVWAVGVMLWEALTGARLFDRDTDFLTYQAIVGADVPSVNAGGARYPAGIDRVVGRALARDRAARYPSARQLGHDLQAIAAEVGGAASREQIADAVSRLCGAQMAARRGAIATAITARSAAQARASSATRAGPDARPGDPARNPATSPGEAAETISMMMRRDAIVVARRRRRRWLAGAFGAALVILASAIAVVATRKGPATQTVAAGSEAANASDGSAGSATRAPGSGSPAPEVHAAATEQPDARDEVAAPAAPPRAHAPAGGKPASRDGARPATAHAPARDQPTGPRAPPREHAPTAGDAVLGDLPSELASARETLLEVRRALQGDVLDDESTEAAPATGRSPTSGTDGDSSSVRQAPAAAASGDSPPARTRRGPAAASTGSGWYAIDSDPYATIFIDDRKVGDTPLDRIPLSAGAHRVRAVLADGRQRSFAIDIVADRKLSAGTLTW